MTSVLEIFREHYPKLVRTLPMNDEYFTADLYSKKLLPGNLKAHIESLDSSAKKASKFLDDVIRPSVEDKNFKKFQALLEVMKENGDFTMEELAEKLLIELRKCILDQTFSQSEKGSVHYHTINLYL